MALVFSSKNTEEFIMILYISGGDMEKELESVGVLHIDLMLSFYISRNKPEKRFLRIYNNRRRIQKRRNKK